MFSNITEAWNNDPVKEMTNKLINSDVFNFKEQGNKANQLRCPGMTKCEDTDNSRTDNSRMDSLSLSDNSISLLSENSLNSDYSSFAPVDFTYNRKAFSSDASEGNPQCSYSIRHLKKCGRCYHRLKKLIDRKIKKKFDDIMLDEKMRQIQSANHVPVPAYQPLGSFGLSDAWKETLIIIIGAIIALFIIFLIVRSLNK